MRTIIVTLVAIFSLTVVLTSDSAAEGLPVSKYLEDPEHKNEVVGFYLSAVYTGITLANERAKPPIFCMDPGTTTSPYEMIDKRIAQLKQEKRLNEDSTVDEIIMDILVNEYPCKR